MYPEAKALTYQNRLTHDVCVLYNVISNLTLVNHLHYLIITVYGTYIIYHVRFYGISLLFRSYEFPSSRLMVNLSLPTTSHPSSEEPCFFCFIWVCIVVAEERYSARIPVTLTIIAFDLLLTTPGLLFLLRCMSNNTYLLLLRYPPYHTIKSRALYQLS